MEVSPELFAWLTSLNIINPFQTMQEQAMSTFIIPENTVNLLFGGKYFDIILQTLQNSYNKFYSVKLDYVSKLSDLKPIEDEQEYISNSVKYSNWTIIIEVLTRFGLIYGDQGLTQILNGDREMLSKILNQIYDLFVQFLKRSEKSEEGVKESNELNKSVKSFNSLRSSAQKSQKSEYKSNKRQLKIIKKNYSFISPKKNSNEINSSKISNNNNSKINNNKILNKNLSQPNILGSNSYINNNNEKKIPLERAINITELDPAKPYEESTSTLEFFILTLCKNMEMKPRQAIALLSNNRKYLSIICNKGINGDFSKISRWVQDLTSNLQVMLRLVKTSVDGPEIAYSTIGTAVCCKDQNIPLPAIQLLNVINENIGMNWNWFLKEGIDSVIFAVTKHDVNRQEIMNILYEFIKENVTGFFDELKKRLLLSSNERNKVYEFVSSILSITKCLNSYFFKCIQEFVYDICLNDCQDFSYSVSILSDAFFYFYPIDESSAEKTINYFKKCVRNNTQSVFATTVAQFFNLMERFGKIKNKYAPNLYKTLVFLFLESYDNEIKREIILEGFEKFFNTFHQVPLDILIDPYLDQLNTTTSYSLCDLSFLFKIVEHPRIEGGDICDIVQFVLSVTLNNIFLSRTANLILCLIFEKKIIQEKCNTPTLQNSIQGNFIDYINTALDSFMSNITKAEDKALLETPHDIMGENFPNVNEAVHYKIIKCVNDYRKVKKKNSNGLLALLWFFKDHDEVLLRVEEENKPIYEPLEVINKKREFQLKEKERLNYGKRLKNYLSEMQEKKRNINKNKEALIAKKKLKEERIKKNLAERRRITSVMSGIESTQKEVKIDPVILRNNNKALTKIIDDLNKNMNLSKNKKFIEGGNDNNAQNDTTNKKKLIRNLSTLEQSQEQDGKVLINNFSSQKTLNKNKSQQDIINTYNANNNLASNDNSNQNNLESKNGIPNEEMLEKYGQILNANTTKFFDEKSEDYKVLKRMKTLNSLIQPEGTFIKLLPGTVDGRPVEVQTKYKLFGLENKKKIYLPVNLEEEESRELKAINGYNYEYKKTVKYYFKAYGDEQTKTISKNSIIRMMRDKGFEKDKIELEEINCIIRGLFNENLTCFDYAQFSNILVQLGYLVYTKKKPSLTIGESYGIMLRKFKAGTVPESVIELKKKMQPVVDLLLEMKENGEDYNLPEGFRFISKTNVRYNSRLAPHFQTFLGEGKFICYQILEDIIFQVYKSSIIEPYVEMENTDDVVIEPEKVHKWSVKTTETYVQMGPEYKVEGMAACDSLEDGFRSLIKLKNKNISGIFQTSNYEEEKQHNKKHNAKVAQYLQERKKEIQKKFKEYKSNKEKAKKEKIRQRKEMVKKMKESYEKKKKKFEEVQQRRKNQEEEKHNKLLEEQEKNKKKDEQKTKHLVEFYKEQKVKLKEQFRSIVEKRSQIIQDNYSYCLKEKNESFIQQRQKERMLNLINKEKDQRNFEKTLNSNIRELIKKKEIKAVFDKYKHHLKLIYEIYSKIGYNKISFFSKEVIKLNEFKEFCINFAILGILVSTEQMNWIFRIISNPLANSRDRQKYFDKEDFEVSLAYLTIFSKFADRTRKEILQNDLDRLNEENLDQFFKYLGLKLPYNKIEVENIINQRRAMTVKNLLSFQYEMKKNSLNDFKKNDQEKEEQKREKLRKKVRDRERKRLLEIEQEQKEMAEKSREGGTIEEKKEEEQEGEAREEEGKTNSEGEKEKGSTKEEEKSREDKKSQQSIKSEETKTKK